MTLFTKIIQGTIPSYKIAESEKFFAFLDIFPLQKGHTLIVPKLEIDKIFDVPDEYLAELLLFAKPIAKAIEASFECNRVGMVTVGLEVPHAHLHLIPINQAKDMEFSGPKLSFTPEEMIAIQNEIVSKLKA
ncbi:MAG: HIT domain-containing protein [Chitinophagaceae bacterium]|nr:MAG: HIT domain-containing protein [Chitinophagaceae bacterium]